MKKIISVSLALCMLVTSLFSGTLTFAQTTAEQATKPTTAQIKAQISGAADYLVTDESAFTSTKASSVNDLLTLINSGKDMSAYEEAFIQSVRDNLAAHNAKLMETVTVYSTNENGETVTEDTYVESPALYAAVILTLDAYGYDPQSFAGYNLVSSFWQVDFENVSDNPYLYRLTLAAAAEYEFDAEFVKKACDTFVNTYYKLGCGMDYYGYSCDNTAMFIITMAPYYDDYKIFVDDALEVIEGYKAEGGGYFSNADYGTAANADSTALALAAYSAIGDIETAEKLYGELCKFECEKTGVFSYMIGENDAKEENSYATKDALFALESFLAILPECYDGHTYKAVVTAPTCTEKGYTTYTCAVCGDTYKDNEINATGHQYTAVVTAPTCTEKGYTTYTCTVCKNSYKANETNATGHNFTANAAKCSVCGVANPNYVIPQVTGVAVKSRNTSAIRLTWDKIAAAESYVIYQYNDTSKKYDKIATVKATSNSYKVSKLTAGGIYKFRIAAVVNGKEGAKSKYLKTSTNPKLASIASVKSNAKKRVTVKIKTLNCTGYQIQLSTSKNFSTIYKTTTVLVSKTTTKTIGALSGKTYYVRVRAFTKAGGTKQYGKWSDVKSVKVR